MGNCRIASVPFFLLVLFFFAKGAEGQLCFNVTAAPICVNYEFNLTLNDSFTDFFFCLGDLVGTSGRWFSFVSPGGDVMVTVTSATVMNLAWFSMCDTEDPGCDCASMSGDDPNSYVSLVIEDSIPGHEYFVVAAVYLLDLPEVPIVVNVLPATCWKNLNETVEVVTGDWCTPLNFTFARDENHLSIIGVPIPMPGSDFQFGMHGKWFQIRGRTQLFSMYQAMTGRFENVSANVIIFSADNPFESLEPSALSSYGYRGVAKLLEDEEGEVFIVAYSFAYDTEGERNVSITFVDEDCPETSCEWSPACADDGEWMDKFCWIGGRTPVDPSYGSGAQSSLCLINMTSVAVGGNVRNIGGFFDANVIMEGGNLSLVQNSTMAEFRCATFLITGGPTWITGSYESTVPRSVLASKIFAVNAPTTFDCRASQEGGGYGASTLVINSNLTINGCGSAAFLQALVLPPSGVLRVLMDPNNCPNHEYVNIQSFGSRTVLNGTLVLVFSGDEDPPLDAQLTWFSVSSSYVDGLFEGGVFFENLPDYLTCDIYWNVGKDHLAALFHYANSSAPTIDICDVHFCPKITDQPTISELSSLNELRIVPNDVCDYQVGKFGKWFQFTYYPPNPKPPSVSTFRPKRMFSPAGESITQLPDVIAPDRPLGADPYITVKVSTSFTYTTFDTVLWVFLGNCSDVVDLTCQAVDDDGGSSLSSIVRVTMDAQGYPSPETSPFPSGLDHYDYYVLLTGFRENVGDYGINVVVNYPDDSSQYTGENATCDAAHFLHAPHPALIQDLCPVPWPPGNFSCDEQLWVESFNGSLSVHNKLSDPPIRHCNVPAGYDLGTFAQYFVFLPQYHGQVFLKVVPGTLWFDTVVYLFYSKEQAAANTTDGCDYVTTFDCVVANDDNPTGEGKWSLTKRVDVTPGIVYYALVTGFTSARGDYSLSLNYDLAERYTDDAPDLFTERLDGGRQCNESVPVEFYHRYLSSLSDLNPVARPADESQCEQDVGRWAVWYSLDDLGNDDVVVQLLASYSMDLEQDSAPQIHVFAGESCESMTCYVVGTVVRFHIVTDDSPRSLKSSWKRYESEVVAVFSGNQSYFVAISSKEEDLGPFQLDVRRLTHIDETARLTGLLWYPVFTGIVAFFFLGLPFIPAITCVILVPTVLAMGYRWRVRLVHRREGLEADARKPALLAPHIFGKKSNKKKKLKIKYKKQDVDELELYGGESYVPSHPLFEQPDVVDEEDGVDAQAAKRQSQLQASLEREIAESRQMESDVNFKLGLSDRENLLPGGPEMLDGVVVVNPDLDESDEEGDGEVGMFDFAPNPQNLRGF